MPNQANKSKDKDGIVQKKKKPTMPVTDNESTEGKDNKQGNGGKVQKGGQGSSAKKQG